MMSLQYGLAKSFCAVTQWGGEGLFHSFWVISKMCGPASSAADHWAAVMPTDSSTIPSFLQTLHLHLGKWLLVLALRGPNAHLSYVSFLISSQMTARSARTHPQLGHVLMTRPRCGIVKQFRSFVLPQLKHTHTHTYTRKAGINPDTSDMCFFPSFPLSSAGFFLPTSLCRWRWRL